MDALLIELWLGASRNVAERRVSARCGIFYGRRDCDRYLPPSSGARRPPARATPRHDTLAALVIAIRALLSGCEDHTGLAELAAIKRGFLHGFLMLTHSAPDHGSTCRRSACATRDSSAPASNAS
jgi:hypothetical protein